MLKNLTNEEKTLKENHKLIKKTLKLVCNKFNKLKVDFYVVGSLSVYLIKNKLVRYHDDIDFMILESDLKKVKKVLSKTNFIFEDNRLSNHRYLSGDSTYTMGEHELVANHKNKDFHLGFFLINKETNGSITVKEHFKAKDTEDRYILYKNTPKKLADMLFNSNVYNFYGAKFKATSPENVYVIKQSTKREKDKFDLKIWEEWNIIDKDKVKKILNIEDEFKTHIYFEKI